MAYFTKRVPIGWICSAFPKLKFRTLDDATLQRLENASEAELELWTERILFANSMDEVFAPQ